MNTRFALLIVFGALLLSSNLCFGQAKLGETKTYTFKKVGWTMEAPVSWTILSNEEEEKLRKKGIDTISALAQEDITDKLMDSKVINLITAKKNETNYFVSVMQLFDKTKYSFAKCMNMTDTILYSSFVNMKLKCDSSSGTKDIDGLRFFVFHVKIDVGNGIFIREDMYSRLINGYCFSIIMVYLDEDSKALMMDMMKSSKFSIRD